jgi:hypothetical protein
VVFAELKEAAWWPAPDRLVPSVITTYRGRD